MLLRHRKQNFSNSLGLWFFAGLFAKSLPPAFQGLEASKNHQASGHESLNISCDSSAKIQSSVQGAIPGCVIQINLILVFLVLFFTDEWRERANDGFEPNLLGFRGYTCDLFLAGNYCRCRSVCFWQVVHFFVLFHIFSTFLIVFFLIFSIFL